MSDGAAGHGWAGFPAAGCERENCGAGGFQRRGMGEIRNEGLATCIRVAQFSARKLNPVFRKMFVLGDGFRELKPPHDLKGKAVC